VPEAGLVFAKSIATALLVAALAAPGLAQSPAPSPKPAAPAGGVTGPGPQVREDGPLGLTVFTFRHQSAAEALPTVRALLSPRGSVALDEGSNTLSVRDVAPRLTRIARIVSAIDHVSQSLAIDVQLIRAETAQVSPALPTVGIAADLLTRLKKIFRYDSYVLVARSRIDTREGEAVTNEIGDGYRLTFRPGTVFEGGRLRLSGFAVARRQAAGGDRDLVRTAVNLRRDQPLILGLTRDEGAARAILLALRFETPPAPAAPAPAAGRKPTG
jgi:hypothetical protein